MIVSKLKPLSTKRFNLKPKRKKLDPNKIDASAVLNFNQNNILNLSAPINIHENRPASKTRQDKRKKNTSNESDLSSI